MLSSFSLKMYQVLVPLFLVLVLGIWTAWISGENKRLEELYKISQNNVIAYSMENDTLKSENGVFKLTIDELKNSKDSTIQLINKLRKEAGIKDKRIKDLEYIVSQSRKKDTITLKDTVFVEDLELDTVIADKYSRLELRLKYPNIIEVDRSFTNEFVIINHLKKEFASEPSKVFFIRWFQKKIDVLTTTIKDLNPYSTIKQYKQIEIINND